jgi:hypothetical protein
LWHHSDGDFIPESDTDDTSEEEKYALSAAQRRGGEEPEQYAPDATWGYKENASLNTDTNCKSYTCTVLHVK